MTYHQITSDERYRLSDLRKQGWSNRRIAQALGRHRSTIWREIGRNRHVPEGYYRVERAIQNASAKSYRSRSHSKGRPGKVKPVWRLIRQWWSPEQVASTQCNGQLRISHETIYRHIWADLKRGGD